MIPKRMINLKLFIPAFCLLICTLCHSQKRTIISGNIRGFYQLTRPDCDTLILEVYENKIEDSVNDNTPKVFIGKMDGTINEYGVLRDAKFRFDITEIKNPAYFTLRAKIGVLYNRKDPELLSRFLVEPGDSVVMNFGVVTPVYYFAPTSKEFCVPGIDIDQIKFSGFGAEKYDFQFRLRIPNRIINKDKIYLPDSIRQIRYSFKHQRSLLEDFKPLLSKLSYEILLANIYYNRENQQPGEPIKVSDSALLYSSKFTGYVFASLAGNGLGQAKIYDSIKKRYSGIVCEKLLSEYFFKFYDYIPSQIKDSVINDAIANLKLEGNIRKLEELRDRKKVGAPAYNFFLPNANRQIVALEQLKGKTILLDFWYSGCGACGLYYRNVLSKLEKEMEGDSSIVFVTISVDNSWETWKNNLRTGIYTSVSHKNVINLFTEARGKDHPVVKYYNVYGYPRPLIIDKNGKIFKIDASLMKYDLLKKSLNEAKDL